MLLKRVLPKSKRIGCTDIEAQNDECIDNWRTRRELLRSYDDSYDNYIIKTNQIKKWGSTPSDRICHGTIFALHCTRRGNFHRTQRSTYSFDINRSIFLYFGQLQATSIDALRWWGAGVVRIERLTLLRYFSCNIYRTASRARRHRLIVVLLSHNQPPSPDEFLFQEFSITKWLLCTKNGSLTVNTWRGLGVGSFVSYLYYVINL